LLPAFATGLETFAKSTGRALGKSTPKSGREQEHGDQREHDACKSGNVNPANELCRFRVFLAHPCGE